MLAVCGACQLTATVAVDGHANGSGLVRVGIGLDKDAVSRVPNLASDLRVDDLRKRGWTIVGPRRESDGRTWVRASKPFDRIYRSFGLPPYKKRIAQAKEMAATLQLIPCDKLIRRIEQLTPPPRLTR